jgi:hypothetical protein
LGRALSLDLQVLDPSKFADVIGAKLTNTRDFTVASFKSNMSTDCVGYLHLERLSFTPAGIERGELVYSVPLSPGEEVNIAHKEWSNTSEEFQRIVTDYLEDYSEEGVTEKSELAESINSQTQHTSAFNASVTASGDFWGVHISTSLGYNTSDSASKSEQLSRNKTTEITNKASSRVKKEHKISFTVASAAGTEDQKIQKIKNPFPNRPTRVDYYQLIRKWKVDLYRYGVRLTLDLVISEPGKELLSKIIEIYNLRKELELPLNFDLVPEDISLDPSSDKYYTKVASDKKVSITKSTPPAIRKTNLTERTFHWAQEKKYGGWETVEVTVDEGYQVEESHIVVSFEVGTEPWSIWGFDVTRVKQPLFFQDSNGYPDPSSAGKPDPIPYTGWNGRTDKLVVLISFDDVNTLQIVIVNDLRLQDKIVMEWQQKIWKEIYDGVQAKYYEDHQKLKEKLARLEEELGAQDALSLRKKEREEVMRCVLVYLGLPPQNYRQNSRAIKLLHHGIEWENMLYILYPYFWAKEEDWEFKKSLDHPDLTHRAFLKAGCARVVLTIRPGYEDALLMFVNTAQIEGLPPSPYLEIGEEFKAYASANYPGIPPAHPVESYRPLLSYNQQKTWERMQLLMRLLEGFYKTHRRYAGRLEELQEVFPMKDPWGKDYQYTYPGSPHPYNLYTWGRDGQDGGDGENADINSLNAESFKRDYSTQVQACEDMQLIAWLLEEYFKTNQKYPTALTDPKLKALIPTKDSWDNNFVYACPGVHSDYDLVSYGADRKPRGEGENADIPSWAEASLIGTWYEYTPTSALDIEFDQEMPKA